MRVANEIPGVASGILVAMPQGTAVNLKDLTQVQTFAFITDDIYHL